MGEVQNTLLLGTTFGLGVCRCQAVMSLTLELSIDDGKERHIRRREAGTSTSICKLKKTSPRVQNKYKPRTISPLLAAHPVIRSPRCPSPRPELKDSVRVRHYRLSKWTSLEHDCAITNHAHEVLVRTTPVGTVSTLHIASLHGILSTMQPDPQRITSHAFGHKHSY